MRDDSLHGPSIVSRAGIRLMERFRKTEALKLLPALLESQWWSNEQLRSLQLARLKEHLIFCAREVPYYRDLFQQHSFDPERFADPSALQSLPLLTKRHIQELGDNLLPSSFGKYQPRKKKTSGSTGIPLNYYLDRPSHSFLWAQIWRAWHQFGYQPGHRYATLSGGALVPDTIDFKQRIYTELNGAIQYQSYHLTDTIIDGYLHEMARKGLWFLYAYPSSAELIARRLLANPDLLSPVRAIATTSEVFTPQAREIVQRAFKCAVHDTYGCNDGGMQSFECEEHSGFHMAMESVFVEIVDDNGRQLPENSVGRIVTTHFSNKSHPFVRYLTGDVGAISTAPCACGRGLSRIINLQGRERDLVLTPDGRKIHGAFFNNFKPFYVSEWLERFQIYQPDHGKLVVRLTVHRPPTEDEKAFIITELRRGLGEMDITVDIVENLMLTAAGKFRVIISDLKLEA